ncbi:type II secretion system protein GspD [Hippea jasoniae]|uniref:type II secretion system protein GspD n=1 Tax=Hippea jasoniae TaxID=944479 RepID=UPI00054D7D82|nr:hypothetical protein [Hippea jasoniae]
MLRQISFALLTVFLLSSCSLNMFAKKEKPTIVEKYLNKPLIKKNQNPKPLNVNIKPVKEKVDILNTIKISFFSKSISYKDAIVEILKPYNINVAFDSRLNSFVTNPDISLSLNNVTLKDALDTITSIVNVGWQKKDGVIWITPIISKTFDLSFLNIIRSSSSTLGGDVLGGGQSGSSENVSSPLQGSFTLKSTTNAKSVDIYSLISQNVKTLLSKNGVYVLDPSSGMLLVKDTPYNVHLVDDYISKLKSIYGRQVMIEAKIIEVQLSKQYQLGINWGSLLQWNKISQTINIQQNTIDFGTNHPNMTINISRIFHPGQVDVTLNSLVEAFSKFGNLKLISEPHIRVMNTQPALLAVGRSINFIKSIEITQQSTGESTVTTPSVEISSIFDGIMFGITPFIRKNDTVLLRIVPIKSNLIALQEREISGNTYTLPQVDLREASTVVSAKSGDIIVIGGLISKQSKNTNSGMPGLKDVPVVGNLFKQQGSMTDNVELVILLKPVILNNNQ